MTTEHNKAIARRFFDEVITGGDLDAVDELCGPSYKLHATLSGPEAIDRSGVKELVGSFRASFSDARITIEDIVADGDLVAARLLEGMTSSSLPLGWRPRNLTRPCAGSSRCRACCRPPHATSLRQLRRVRQPRGHRGVRSRPDFGMLIGAMREHLEEMNAYTFEQVIAP